MLNISSNFLDILSKSGGVFFLKIISASLTFAVSVVLARKLGAENFGLYTIVLSIMTIGSVLARLGLDSFLLRKIAYEYSLLNIGSIDAVSKQGIKIASFGSIIVILFLLFDDNIITFYALNNDGTQLPYTMMLPIVFSFCMVGIYSELLRATDRINSSILVSSIMLPLLTIVLILLFYRLVTGIFFPIIITVLASYITYAVSVFIWHRRTKELERLKVNDIVCKDSWGRIVILSLPLLFVSSAAIVMSWVDTLMLGSLKNSEAVGVYQASVKISGLMSFIMVSINTVIAPKFSHFYAQGNIDNVAKIARYGFIIGFCISLPVFVTIIVFAKNLVSVFGGEFIKSTDALIILSSGQFINIVTGSVGYLLIMIKRQNVVFYAMIIGLALNITLNYFLIKKFSIVGAAFSTAISLSVVNLILLFFVTIILKIRIIPYFIDIRNLLYKPFAYIKSRK